MLNELVVSGEIGASLHVLYVRSCRIGSRTTEHHPQQYPYEEINKKEEEEEEEEEERRRRRRRKKSEVKRSEEAKCRKVKRSK